MVEMTATEQKVAAIWKSIVGPVELTPESTFFQIGGDSITMIDMLVEVGTSLNVEVDPSLLFDDSSLRGFSRHIDSAKTAEQ